MGLYSLLSQAPNFVPTCLWVDVNGNTYNDSAEKLIVFCICSCLQYSTSVEATSVNYGTTKCQTVLVLNVNLSLTRILVISWEKK